MMVRGNGAVQEKVEGGVGKRSEVLTYVSSLPVPST